MQRLSLSVFFFGQTAQSSICQTFFLVEAVGTGSAGADNATGSEAETAK
jgi:hypothetical protein